MESAQTFRTLVEQISTIVYVEALDEGDEPACKLLYVSSKVQDVMGYPPEDWLANPGLREERLHPDDRERVLAERARSKKTGEPLKIGYRSLARDGEVVWVCDEAALVRDEAGRPLHWQGVQYDVTGLKRAEEKRLEENEARLAEVQRLARVGSWEWEIATDTVTWSDELHRIYGVSPQDFGGNYEAFIKVVHPEYRGTVEEMVRSSLERREPFVFERRLVRPNGEEQVIEARAEVFVDGSGEPVRMVGTVQDVTERKLVEEALRSSEAGLAEAQRLAHLGSWEAEPVKPGKPREDHAMRWSDEMYRIFGYAPREFEPTFGRLVEATHPEDRESVAEAVREAVSGRESSAVVEHRVLLRDGEVRYVQARVEMVYGEGGGLARNFGTVLDVTERRQAEEALRRTEERYRAVIEQSTEGIFLAEGETGRVLETNPAFRAMLGYTADELRGMEVHGFVAIPPEEVGAALRRTLAERRRFVGDREYRRKDGTLVDVEVGVSVISYGGKEVVCAVVRDVTERKRAEEELRRSEGRLLAAQRIARVGDWSFDVVRNEAHWSDEMRRIFGLEPQAPPLTYKEFLSHVHPGDRALVKEAARAALNGESPSGLAHRAVRPDGEVRFVHSQYEVKCDASGRVVELIGTLQDVTELRQAEARLREQARVLDLAPVLIRDLDDRIVSWNTGARKMYGWKKKKALGRVTHELLRSEHPEPIEEIKAKILGEGRWEGEIVHTRKDGTRIAVTSLQVLHRDERGEPTAILEVNNDVTERNLAQRALAESEERYRHLVELSPEAVMVHSEGEVVYANEAAARLIGAASSAELIGKPIMGFAHPDYREMAVERIREAFATGEPIPLREEKIVCLDGAVIDVEVTGVPIVYDGKPAIQLLARDIRERKQAAEALRRSEERFRSLVQNSSDVVSVIGADGTAQYVSPSIERVLGYNPEDAIGNSVFEPLSVHPDDVARVRSAFAELFAKGRGASIADELRLRHADGSWRYIEAIGKNLVDDPSVGGIVVNYRDVTERKAFEKHLEHKAFHDDLTNLPNRALFVDRLEEALARLDRSEDKAAAVLFMDLDNFKVVNDSLGHVAGDQLLVAVAGRLRSGMRPGDTVARFGGDEFAVLLEGVEGASDAVKVAERILKELQPPFALGGREVFALPSIGISLGTTASNRAEDLLRGADTALYEVKARGKAGYALFDPSMHDKALKRLRTESDLRRALENGEFRVYYQPKMRLSTDIRHSLRSSGSQAIVARKRETKQIPRIEGTEALVRWEHPEMGLISPDEFISVAEETGLIVQLGRWVLEEACLQTRRWNELYPGDPPLTVCVNLSGRQFQDPGLAQDVARILQETGLNPQCLNLEITESVLMEDARSTIATLLELKYLGVELSIDDFGTGYSSLSYLKRFPVDHLKIDRSFVGELKKDAEDTMLVSGIIRLAHTMGMRVVAEGVESAEQMQRLQGLGCDLAQGYYLSEPLPGEAVPGFLAHDQQRSKS